MFPIAEARFLAPDVKLFRIAAPRVARKRRPGQFVIVRVHEEGERIPLTIADSSAAGGTVTLIVQGVGKTTRLMNLLEAGDALLDLVGPLGRPTEVERFGTVVVVGGGVGAAIAYPSAVALAEAGNRVVTILGARSRDLLILEDELAAVSDELIVTTDDGSRGRRGLVTDVLAERLGARPADAGRKALPALIGDGAQGFGRLAGEPVDRVLAIGPIPMMRAVAETTRPHGVRTIVSLNPIMVDGTGMCGGCRVLVGGTSRFACVDGPEFDAHEVDFRVLQQRNAAYRREEREALAAFAEDPGRHLAAARGGACRAEAGR